MTCCSCSPICRTRSTAARRRRSSMSPRAMPGPGSTTRPRRSSPPRRRTAGHAAERCDLPSAELALVFLGYPDGFVSGNHPDSLLRLWEGAIDHADTVAEHPARYDRQGLIDAVGEIIALSRPAIIRTLELSAMHGTDHSDHMLVGALALLAAAPQPHDATTLSYRGYNVNFEPPNIPDAIFNEISLGMRAYEACQIGCAPCGEVCETLPDSRYLGFLHRHYAVATR